MPIPISEIVSQVPQLRRGIVWCTVCGRSKAVDSGRCLAHGWPKCCGYTMTIDSPDEQANRRVEGSNGD